METSELEVWDFEEFDDFEEDDVGESFDIEDAEDSEFEDFEDEDIESFGEDSAEGKRSRRRRAARARARAARRRRQLSQRRRAAKRRPRSPARRATPARKIASNRANIKKVGLESAVKADVLAKGLGAHSKRIGGTENAIAASKVVDEFKGLFEKDFPDLFDNKLVKTGLPLAPLLFLKPPKKGNSIGALALDPRVWGPALSGVLAIVSELRNKVSEPKDVMVSPTGIVLAANDQFPFTASVRDDSGKFLSGRTINWTSSDRIIADVDNTGLVTAKKAGRVTITATDDKASTARGALQVEVR
ncbi:MAG: Ig-like domain-containing protein [Gammaproteobacteria bacterium]|nr:Ig-like domain-containing protein [Gammaproteobacteria bacterium]